MDPFTGVPQCPYSLTVEHASNILEWSRCSVTNFKWSGHLT